jgi:uncharacterized delta-60 repeat protein
MNRKWLRIALPVLCIGLVQCTASTTTSSGPPTALATLRLVATSGVGDNTFGPNKNSLVVTDIDSSLSDFALAVAIQTIAADNKIVAVGSNGLAGQGQVALVRYNSDGSLDTTFGGTGIVKTVLGAPASATAVAIQGDNRIVVAALVATSDSNSSTGLTTSIVVLRYNTDGTPDTGFGTGGVTTAATPVGTGLAGDTCAMLLQSGPAIVVAGATQDGKLVLARYTSAGALDPAFGTSGTTVTSLAPPSPSNFTQTSPAMAAQSDGRIIVVTRNGDDQAVLRYSVDGAPDTGFGGATNGIVITPVGSGINYANAVAIQDASGAAGNTDKIIVAGHTNVTDTTSDISLVRYTKDGVLDTTFNTTGIVTVDIFGQFDNALAVLMQDQAAGAEPKILVSGNTGFGSSTQTFVLRYNSDGTADPTFGSAAVGRVLVPVVGPSTVASGNAMAIQNGGGIIVTGFD